MYDNSPGVRFELDGPILKATFDSPERRNALRDEDVVALTVAVRQANNDERVRAILIAGANGNFCTGADIVDRNKAKGDRPRVGAIARRLPGLAHGLVPQLMSAQVPVITAVEGYAVGLGLQLVAASDFAVVSADAVLWEPFAKRGMGPDGGASWLLPKLVGVVRARELLLLGRRLSGDEAVEWGLAHRAVPASDVDAVAGKLASELASGPTVALGVAKMLINQGHERTLVDHLAQEGYGMEVSSRSPDFREGLAAFVQKREPIFTGK